MPREKLPLFPPVPRGKIKSEPETFSFSPYIFEDVGTLASAKSKPAYEFKAPEAPRAPKASPVPEAKAGSADNVELHEFDKAAKQLVLCLSLAGNAMKNVETELGKLPASIDKKKLSNLAREMREAFCDVEVDADRLADFTTSGEHE